MKKLILAGLLIGSSVNLMADYLVGYLTCEIKDGSGDTIAFVAKAKNASSSSRSKSRKAMAEFLNDKYSNMMQSNCYHGKVHSSSGGVYYFDYKSGVNRKYSHIKNDYIGLHGNVIKTIGAEWYNESDWR